MVSRRTIILILILVVILAGGIFVMQKYGGEEKPAPTDTYSILEDESASTTIPYIEAWLKTQKLNTPHDIGFPTTTDETDFVPPKGWVKYTFSFEDIGVLGGGDNPHEDYPDFKKDVYPEVVAFRKFMPKEYKGFEFWYPEEFLKNKIEQNLKIGHFTFRTAVSADAGEYTDTALDYSLYSIFYEKYESPALSIHIERISPQNTIEKYLQDNENAGQISLNGKSVVKTSYTNVVTSMETYGYRFEVGPYVYTLGFGITGQYVQSNDIRNILTTNNETRNEVFDSFFESFRFID